MRRVESSTFCLGLAGAFLLPGSTLAQVDPGTAVPFVIEQTVHLAQGWNSVYLELTPTESDIGTSGPSPHVPDSVSNTSTMGWSWGSLVVASCSNCPPMT